MWVEGGGTLILVASTGYRPSTYSVFPGIAWPITPNAQRERGIERERRGTESECPNSDVRVLFARMRSKGAGSNAIG